MNTRELNGIMFNGLLPLELEELIVNYLTAKPVMAAGSLVSKSWAQLFKPKKSQVLDIKNDLLDDYDWQNLSVNKAFKKIKNHKWKELTLKKIEDKIDFLLKNQFEYEAFLWLQRFRDKVNGISRYFHATITDLGFKFNPKEIEELAFDKFGIAAYINKELINNLSCEHECDYRITLPALPDAYGLIFAFERFLNTIPLDQSVMQLIMINSYLKSCKINPLYFDKQSRLSMVDGMSFCYQKELVYHNLCLDSRTLNIDNALFNSRYSTMLNTLVVHQPQCDLFNPRSSHAKHGLIELMKSFTQNKTAVNSMRP